MCATLSSLEKGRDKKYAHRVGKKLRSLSQAVEIKNPWQLTSAQQHNPVPLWKMPAQQDRITIQAWAAEPTAIVATAQQHNPVPT